ncbi:MAG: hypothetical protein VCA55_12410 [Verrucomicrobiales bacterium]
MPPLPQLRVAAILLFAITPLPIANAQIWGGASGYNDLAAELGGPPATNYAATNYLQAADSSWRYRRGTSEPSNPVDAWRKPVFAEDGSWFTGQSPIGYGDGDDNTLLSDMRNAYSTVYLRHEFNIQAGSIPARLTLRVYVDDGAIVWINGTEVARLFVTTGFKSFNSLAAVHEAQWQDVQLNNTGDFLLEGSNVIAIHAINQHPNSSDFSIDAELVSPALRVTQVEAASGTDFLPQDSGETNPPVGFTFSGTDIFLGKTFHLRNTDPGLTYGKSSHAGSVGNRFYSSNSIAPQVDLIDNYYTGNWIGSNFLRTGSPSQPRIETSALQNHSWVVPGHASDATIEQIDNDIRVYTEIVRRLDYAMNRDGFVTCAGLNTRANTTVPPVFGASYNAISVGLTSGGHSRGGTISAIGTGSGAVEYDGVGRTKPEIVANDSATSYSTAQVSSAAALLLGVANNRGMGNAFRPEVIKAILMAGATKSEFTNWKRTTTQPIDTVFGAGEMNVQNSYHILVGGEVTTGITAGHYGWDRAALPAGGNSVYSLKLEEDITEFSVMLNWNRTIITAPWLGGGSYNESIADMSLQLHRVDNGISVLLDASDSSIDNLEHLYLQGLSAGNYTLTVTTDIAGDYALAWRADRGKLPGVTFAARVTENESTFSFTNLIPGKEFTLGKSANLISWSDHHVFTPAEESESFTDPTGHAAGATAFYRLSWDPVN